MKLFTEMNLEERTKFINDERQLNFKNFVTTYYTSFGWNVTDLGECLSVKDVFGRVRTVLPISVPHESDLTPTKLKTKLEFPFTVTCPELSYPFPWRGTKSYSVRIETASGITFYHFDRREQGI